MIGSRARLSTGVIPAVQDERAALQPEHLAVIERRAAPAVFIVDKKLRVLFYRADPSERRKEFRPADNGALPPSLEYTVLKLLVQDEDQTDTVRRAALSSSVAVKVLELRGGSVPAYAILVERFALRDHIDTFARKHGLSPRERQVLALLVKGLRNEEIAQHLIISKSTAIFHVKQLLTKTGSRNRTEMVAKIID
jgi:DNA-binding CsgD family transcriptional regulator